MAAISLDLLGGLFLEAFGYRSSAFDPKFADVPNPRGIGKGLQRKEQGNLGSPMYGIANGREYYLPVRLTYAIPSPTGQQSAIAGTLRDGGGAARTTTSEDFVGVSEVWDLPHPIVAIKQDSTVVETPMTERVGAVAELVSVNNPEISIKGFMIGDNQTYPEAMLATLQRIFGAGISMKMRSVPTDIYLQPFEYNVTMRSMNLPPVTGIKWVKPYELIFRADPVFSLYEV